MFRQVAAIREAVGMEKLPRLRCRIKQAVLKRRFSVVGLEDPVPLAATNETKVDRGGALFPDPTSISKV